jgi:hypothetical protein
MEKLVYCPECNNVLQIHSDNTYTSYLYKCDFYYYCNCKSKFMLLFRDYKVIRNTFNMDQYYIDILYDYFDPKDKRFSLNNCVVIKSLLDFRIICTIPRCDMQISDFDNFKYKLMSFINFC